MSIWTASPLILRGARYADIPVGNLQNDFMSLINDVLYNRLLHLYKYISWASETPQPDFGGKESLFVDDCMLVLVMVIQ